MAIHTASGKVLIELPASINVVLRLFVENSRSFRVRLSQHPETILEVKIITNTGFRRNRIKMERVFPGCHLPGIVSIKQPLSGLNGDFLILHRCRHRDTDPSLSA